MQKVDLAELRRLHKAATKGEWAAKVGHSGARLSLFLHRGPNSDGDYLNGCGNDVEFIAAAHNALPALLDELEAAREEVRQLAQTNDDLRKEPDRVVAEAMMQDGVVEELWADNAKLAWAWNEVQSDTPKEAQDKARIIQAAVACLNSLAWLDARDRRQKLIGAAEEWELEAGIAKASGRDLITYQREYLEQRAAKLRQEAEDGK